MESDYWKDNNIEKPKSVVVCAANRLPNGLILCGARHWDKVMRKMANALNYDGVTGGVAEQGFINQFGEFLTREEAYIIAKENSQLIRDDFGGNELFSENLY